MPGSWCPNGSCCRRCGDREYGEESNYLRVFMAQVRRKLEPEPSTPRYFITEPGHGLPVRTAGRVTRCGFVPGIELNRAFYTEVVGPVVARWPHGAALLGWGSDVLGYDTERSTDHGWGPRVTVFVGEDDLATVRGAVDEGLPDEFAGRPVRYGWDRVEARHHVDVVELGSWLHGQLGRDPGRACRLPTGSSHPQQQLLGVLGGAVYHDPEGALSAVRQALAWYPDDVWAWLVACQWHRVAQEEPFAGRAAEVGDDLGSRVVAARLARGDPARVPAEPHLLAVHEVARHGLRRARGRCRARAAAGGRALRRRRRRTPARARRGARDRRGTAQRRRAHRAARSHHPPVPHAARSVCSTPTASPPRASSASTSPGCARCRWWDRSTSRRFHRPAERAGTREPARRDLRDQRQRGRRGS